jgi:hypothetical protein
MTTTTLTLLLCVFSVVSTSASTPSTILNCTFKPVGDPVKIVLTNKCGKHAKIRTCPAPFKSCVGYMQQKNHYVDCPERIENNTTMTLLLDNSRSYILIDCPDWWPPKGSGIDNWWTVAPVDAKWPASYLLPPYNKTV